uniref:RNA-directed RNA polymerase n=1 Tax=Leviviridae sp. TaxID=2027243 RepID=A0A514DA47_9VIRU|nr:MAG: RNA-dependent RNA polymerase [Leviviridae sp.]
MPSNFLSTAVEKAVLRLFEDLATPVSLKVSLLWKAGEWDQIASQRLDPRHYDSADRFWRDSMAVDLVRKLRELPTSVNRALVAEESFLSSEEECFRTNRRLLPYLSPGLPGTEQGVCEFLSRARKIAAKILGPCPDSDIDGRHGPGATFGDSGRRSTVPHKMSSVPTLTRFAWPYLLQWYGNAWGKTCASERRVPEFVRGNRFTTVPKDCSKDRGIAIEPSVNVFYQLAYGRIIRSRLKAAGVDIDLRRGQDIHARLAREASIQGHLATIDLSNASDTICSNLVKLVLPAGFRHWTV